MDPCVSPFVMHHNLSLTPMVWPVLVLNWVLYLILNLESTSKTLYGQVRTLTSSDYLYLIGRCLDSLCGLCFHSVLPPLTYT